MKKPESVFHTCRGIKQWQPHLTHSYFLFLPGHNPTSDNTFLDWFEPSTDAAHPVFGRIMENYNLVLQISQVSTRNDNPVAPIKMISIRVK